MERLLPDPGPTEIEAELGDYRPWETDRGERPFVATNMVTTLDGHTDIGGRSDSIGTKEDLGFLLKLRTRFDAVMIGAGTMRAERYGRIVPDEQERARRERIGLPHDPLAVLLSASLDLPYDSPLFTDGGGRVLIYTTSDQDPPDTATPVSVHRAEAPLRMPEVLAHLRSERGIRAVLCEGGPSLIGQLAERDLIDDFFLTIAPKLLGGAGAGVLDARLEGPKPLQLTRLLSNGSELLARYSAGR